MARSAAGPSGGIDHHQVFVDRRGPVGAGGDLVAIAPDQHLALELGAERELPLALPRPARAFADPFADEEAAGGERDRCRPRPRDERVSRSQGWNHDDTKHTKT